MQTVTALGNIINTSTGRLSTSPPPPFLKSYFLIMAKYKFTLLATFKCVQLSSGKYIHIAVQSISRKFFILQN